jgi:hypothetical protein
MKHLLFALLWVSLAHAQPQPKGMLKRLRADAPDLKTPYELKGPNYTATHDEVVAYCSKLTGFFNNSKLIELGPTDVGRPLHLLVLSNQRHFTPEQARRAGVPIIWINNAIHPGEPEGVDASLMLARDLLADERANAVLNEVVICIVPMYNIDGALRRGRSRVNQNGPAEYGFRGSARNLDLNRDFVKMDSRNARSWVHAFTAWRPHILLDNHTTNGADYPAVMTLIHSQRAKLHPLLSDLLVNQIVPNLRDRMRESGFPIMPYWNPHPTVPDTGLVEFNETPRYSSGFAALHNCMGLIAETHMLKPYPQRVQATYLLMRHLINKVVAQAAGLVSRKAAADAAIAKQDSFATRWRWDATQSEPLILELFARKTEPSAVTGQMRIRYDTSEVLTVQRRYFGSYRAEGIVARPYAYVVPQAWGEVVERLALNRVPMRQLSQDVRLRIVQSTIERYDQPGRLFEGHVLRTGLVTRLDTVERQYREGDWVVLTDHPAARAVIETLEPEATDSYLTWGFFDSVLGQKEYFSDYVFEDSAAVLLARNPRLKGEFEAKRSAEPAFAKSAAQQLDWLYRRSPWFEASVGVYPVGRLMKPISLPLKSELPKGTR